MIIEFNYTKADGNSEHKKVGVLGLDENNIQGIELNKVEAEINGDKTKEEEYKALINWFSTLKPTLQKLTESKSINIFTKDNVGENTYDLKSYMKYFRKYLINKSDYKNEVTPKEEKNVSPEKNEEEAKIVEDFLIKHCYNRLCCRGSVTIASEDQIKNFFNMENLKEGDYLIVNNLAFTINNLDGMPAQIITKDDWIILKEVENGKPTKISFVLTKKVLADALKEKNETSITLDKDFKRNF